LHDATEIEPALNAQVHHLILLNAAHQKITVDPTGHERVAALCICVPGADAC
jgi:hypothetical protein